MTTTASTVPVAARRRIVSPEIGVAIAAFVALCVAVLLRSAQLLEPDDYAYRASIAALADGHVTLSTAQYQALLSKLGSIAQWVQLPNGSWISEKNPGYPFFAVPFELLGILRAAPLFYGALGCAGLFAGGRRWLGRWGGTAAVALFCASGAALTFAWRATMPTFTDASLVAGGIGALLWALLANDATARRRTLVGLLAFLSLEAAVSMRYTNVLVLAIAIVTVPLARRAAALPWRSVAWWLGSVAVFAAGMAAFDAHYYGGALKTGYASGEITFSTSAIWPNLQHMPYHLVRSMPLLLLGVVAAGWIGVRGARSLRAGVDGGTRREWRRDAAVGTALLACWLAIFGLYLAYTWTVGQGAMGEAISVHVIRFYVPALGAVALLGAWLLTRIPAAIALSTVAALAMIAVATFPTLASGAMPGGGGGGGFGGGMRGTPPAGTSGGSSGSSSQRPSLPQGSSQPSGTTMPSGRSSASST